MVKEWLSREQDCVVKECKYIARSLPRPGEFTIETKETKECLEIYAQRCNVFPLYAVLVSGRSGSANILRFFR